MRPLERRPRYPSGRWPCSDLTRQNALVLFCSFVQHGVPNGTFPQRAIAVRHSRRLRRLYASAPGGNASMRAAACESLTRIMRARMASSGSSPVAAAPSFPRRRAGRAWTETICQARAFLQGRSCLGSGKSKCSYIAEISDGVARAGLDSFGNASAPVSDTAPSSETSGTVLGASTSASDVPSDSSSVPTTSAPTTSSDTSSTSTATDAPTDTSAPTTTSADSTAPSASTAVSTDSTTSTSQSNPPIATRPSSVSPTTGEAWKLTHLRRRRGPHRRDVVLHRVLHLLEGAHLDLAHALPAEAEFLGQLRKRDLFLGEPARLEDAPLALVEHGERIGQRLAAVIELLARGERRLLVRGFVHQPVLPLAGIAVVAGRRVERGVAAEPAVHVDHVLLGDAQALGDQLDLVGPHVAFFQRGNLALRLAQVEEQLLLIGGGAHLHQRPRAQDVSLDRRLDPPHGVGGQPKALLGLEPLDRLHQPDVAFRDHLGDRQAVAAVAHGDLGDEAQVAGGELVRRVAVAVLAPALGQHELFLRLQHREPPDLFEISGKAG